MRRCGQRAERPLELSVLVETFRGCTVWVWHNSCRRRPALERGGFSGDLNLLDVFRTGVRRNTLGWWFVAGHSRESTGYLGQQDDPTDPHIIFHRWSASLADQPAPSPQLPCLFQSLLFENKSPGEASSLGCYGDSGQQLLTATWAFEVYIPSDKALTRDPLSGEGALVSSSE